MIQAIPTTYKGIKYRSKTEAKWALFFDIEHIPYHYEPEGFQTDAGWYVPDFQFVEAERLTFFEVKPTQPSMREYRLLKSLADGAKAHVFVSHGAPRADCPIEKVYSDGKREQWWFGFEHESTCGYLTTHLCGNGLDLKIRQTKNPLGAYCYGPSQALDKAGSAHFDHNPHRSPRSTASLRRSALSAKPLWIIRETRSARRVCRDCNGTGMRGDGTECLVCDDRRWSSSSALRNSKLVRGE